MTLSINLKCLLQEVQFLNNVDVLDILNIYSDGFVGDWTSDEYSKWLLGQLCECGLGRIHTSTRHLPHILYRVYAYACGQFFEGCFHTIVEVKTRVTGLLWWRFVCLVFFTEQNVWEAIVAQLVHTFFYILWNLKFYYSGHRSLLLLVISLARLIQQNQG